MQMRQQQQQQKNITDTSFSGGVGHKKNNDKNTNRRRSKRRIALCNYARRSIRVTFRKFLIVALLRTAVVDRFLHTGFSANRARLIRLHIERERDRRKEAQQHRAGCVRVHSRRSTLRRVATREISNETHTTNASHTFQRHRRRRHATNADTPRERANKEPDLTPSKPKSKHTSTMYILLFGGIASSLSSECNESLCVWSVAPGAPPCRFRRGRHQQQHASCAPCHAMPCHHATAKHFTHAMTCQHAIIMMGCRNIGPRRAHPKRLCVNFNFISPSPSHIAQRSISSPASACV